MDHHGHSFSADYDTIIVGAGISGLSAAYRLYKEGVQRILVLEEASQAGGAIRTENRNGYSLEWGPVLIQRHHRHVRNVCRELGIQLVSASNHVKQKYIVGDGKLKALPRGLLELLATPLLSLPDKLQLSLANPIQPAYSDSDSPCRHPGQSLLNQWVGPYLGSIYADDPDLLSPKQCWPECFKLLRSNVVPDKEPPFQVYRPRDGMQALTHALEQALPPGTVRLNTAVVRAKQSKNRYKVELASGEELTCKTLLVATSASRAGQMLQGFSPEPGELLKAMTSQPIRVLHLAYPDSALYKAPRGFGFLATRDEQRHWFSSVWLSDLFPQMAPSAQRLYTVFLPESAETKDCHREETLCQQTARRFSGLLGLGNLEPAHRWTYVSPHALPRYRVGHEQRLKEISQVLREHPGLFLCGNYWRGLSMDSCVELANETATAIATFLKR